MAGHSKWANIQHRKKAQDNKRGKTFTKVIREITVAAKMGGTDVGSNSRLRLALSKANAANVPKDTVKRAIDKASGQNNDNFEEITYEGYGPKGIAVIIECLTDNKNRTVSDLRHALTKHGGSLGTNGSVSHLFRKVGIMKLLNITEDDLLFRDLPKTFEIGRYHSWVIETPLPNDLIATSFDEQGQLMSLRHKTYHVRGVQFHPESILTPNGKKILENWINS